MTYFKAIFIILVFLTPITNNLGGITKVNNVYQTRNISFEQWLQSLRFCYEKRPQYDELAGKLIKKYPAHNEKYFTSMFVLNLASIFTKKKDKSLERFQNWYLEIINQELEKKQVEELYRLVE